MNFLMSLSSVKSNRTINLHRSRSLYNKSFSSPVALESKVKSIGVTKTPQWARFSTSSATNVNLIGRLPQPCRLRLLLRLEVESLLLYPSSSLSIALAMTTATKAASVGTQSLDYFTPSRSRSWPMLTMSMRPNSTPVVRMIRVRASYQPMASQ